VSATDPDGWFLTGDVGYCDAAGYLIVSGRRDAMFISGGENIHPEEIEAALLSLPGISQAIVVPRLHPEYGFRPVAFIQSETERMRQGRSNKRYEKYFLAIRYLTGSYHGPKTAARASNRIAVFSLNLRRS